MVNDYRLYMRKLEDQLRDLESKVFDREVARHLGVAPTDDDFLEEEDQIIYDEVLRKWELLREWEAVNKSRRGMRK